jgi:hypothetical protein
VQLGAIGPHLTCVDLFHTTAEAAEAVDRGTDYTIGATAKRDHRKATVAFLQEDYQFDAWRSCSDLGQRVKPILVAVLQRRTNQYDIDR